MLFYEALILTETAFPPVVWINFIFSYKLCSSRKAGRAGCGNDNPKHTVI